MNVSTHKDSALNTPPVQEKCPRSSLLQHASVVVATPRFRGCDGLQDPGDQDGGSGPQAAAATSGPRSGSIWPTGSGRRRPSGRSLPSWAAAPAASAGRRRSGARPRGDARRWVYRPHAAQERTDARRPRPKTGKIGKLRDFIQHHLGCRWSPEWICQALRARFSDQTEMQVTHETIYQALYVQGRGELRRELTRALRTGRAMRRPHRQSYKRQPRMSQGMVMISERPAEAADRAILGHWEGDLIIGKAHKSAIGTLVERSSRFVALVHLPDARQPARMRDALIQTAAALPAQLRSSLTWGQGSEMHRPVRPHTRVPGYSGRRAQQPLTQIARLGNPSRASR
ncbi:IS30 family transposase [Streptomyces pristinaespiralis]